MVIRLNYLAAKNESALYLFIQFGFNDQPGYHGLPAIYLLMILDNILPGYFLIVVDQIGIVIKRSAAPLVTHLAWQG